MDKKFRKRYEKVQRTQKDDSVTEEFLLQETLRLKVLTPEKLKHIQEENPDKKGLGGGGKTERPLPEKPTLTEEALERQKQHMRERSPSKVRVKKIQPNTKELDYKRLLYKNGYTTLKAKEVPDYLEEDE